MAMKDDVLTTTSLRPPRAMPSVTLSVCLANDFCRFFLYVALALSATTPLPTDINVLDAAPVTPPTTHNTRVSELSRIILEPFTTSNVTGRHRGPKRKLRAGYRAPSLKRTSHVAMRFHCRVWYRALCLRCACIRSPGITLIP